MGVGLATKSTGSGNPQFNRGHSSGTRPGTERVSPPRFIPVHSFFVPWVIFDHLLSVCVYHSHSLSVALSYRVLSQSRLPWLSTRFFDCEFPLPPRGRRPALPCPIANPYWVGYNNPLHPIQAKVPNVPLILSLIYSTKMESSATKNANLCPYLYGFNLPFESNRVHKFVYVTKDVPLPAFIY